MAEKNEGQGAWPFPTASGTKANTGAAPAAAPDAESSGLSPERELAREQMDRDRKAAKDVDQAREGKRD